MLPANTSARSSNRDGIQRRGSGGDPHTPQRLFTGATQRLSRAQSLLRIASDTAATPQERGHAYEVARRELDGLIVLPDSTRAAIERGIAGEIDG